MSHPDDTAEVRPARPTDVDAIRRCARDAFARHVERIGREPVPMVADFERPVAEGRAHVLVTTDGALLGYAIVASGGAATTLLENLAVRPEHAGRGYGHRLVAMVEADARAAGHEAVELYTNAAMRENLLWYPRLGYRLVGRRTVAGFDRVFFRKALSPRRRTRVAAYGLLIEERRILLCRISATLPRWAGLWTLPGGGVEFGEDPDATVRRELREETGLEVVPRRIVAVDSFTDEPTPEDRFHGIRLLYEIERVGGALRAERGGTSDACAWFTPQEAGKLGFVDIVERGLEHVFGEARARG